MKERYEMLPQQKKIWDIQTAFPGTDICNIGGYLELEGKYDADLLQRMIAIFLETQSAFWTRVDAGGRLYFEKTTDPHMPEYDFRGMERAQVDAQIRRWICEPFVLYDSPLYDFRLLRLDDKAVIFGKFHHLIADGYAVALCAKCQEKIYEKLQAGETEFETDESCLREIMGQAAAGVQDAEIVQAAAKVPERGRKEEKGSGEEETQREIMAEGTAALGKLRFVSLGRRTEKPAAEVMSGYITSGRENTNQTEWYSRRFTYGEIRDFCRAYRVSVESCVYGCLGIYLCRTRNGDALAVARNLLNRSGAAMKEISLKVDTLTFEVKPDWEMTAAEYLAFVKKELAAQARERTSVSVKPDIEISYRPVRYLPVPEKGECREYLNSSVELPMKMFLNDDGREIELQVKYQKDAIGEKEVRRIIRKTLYLLDQCMESPEKKTGELSLTEDGDREKTERFQGTDGWQYTVSLPERFLKVSAACPERTALLYRGETYPYARIKEMADTVRALIAERADPGKRRLIGLCMARSPWLPAAVYGAWLSGYGFLPVSPRDAKERKRRTAQMCALFITDEMLEAYAARKHPFFGEPDIRPEVPAYEIFTSGTTGEPKAVMISHRSLACRLEWMEEQFGDGTDVILQKTRSTFDVSVWELALPFAFGKTMSVLEEGKEAQPEAIAERMLGDGVTMVHFVPSMFAEFAAYLRRHPVKLPELKYLIFSGEALDAELVREAKLLLPRTEIYNLYGPAECTIDVSYYRCSGEEEKIPIGRPVYHTQLTVRNERGELLPIGEKGELVVQGELVGLGYDGGNYGIEEQTSHKGKCKSGTSEISYEISCQQGGYCEIEGKRAYRTGDMAVLGEDGLLYYEGRRDRQIKLRGMRVSLDEIESTLNGAMPGVRHRILCISGRLIDFYQGELREKEAEEKAAELLPYYCVPSEFIQMEKLPTGTHGKTDRAALREEYGRRQSRKQTDRSCFSSDWELARREKRMLEIANSLLEREDVTLDANLFDLGLDSLAVLRFITECEETGIALSYGAVYQNPSIRKLAKLGETVHPVVFLHREKKPQQSGSAAPGCGESGGRLILMVPFAGGTPLSCRKLAVRLRGTGADFAAANLPCYGDKGVREAVEQALDGGWAEAYREIYVIGSCVGSALALEFAARLGDRVKGLMLCESLPYLGTEAFGKVYSVWDYISDRRLVKILQALRGKRFEAGRELLACFRQDVRRSAEYLREGKRIAPGYRVALVFGSEDRITAGYRKRYIKWRRWLRTSYKVYTVPGAKHFLAEEHPAALAGIFRKEFMNREM